VIASSKQVMSYKLCTSMAVLPANPDSISGQMTVKVPVNRLMVTGSGDSALRERFCIYKLRGQGTLKPSSGVSIGVLTNSLQLARSGHCTAVCGSWLFNDVVSIETK
jgi:hypothetical protein